MARALGMKGEAIARGFGRSACFSAGPEIIAAMQHAEPKRGLNVAETVHLLFKMTSV
jgi:hypothetical protein